MKKAILSVCVVLLALLAVTCSNGLLSPNAVNKQAQAADVEPGWVTLNIGVGDNSRARALVDTNAETDTNFYEVVFIYNEGGGAREIVVRSSVAQASFSTWSVDVPAVNYGATGNKAVMFAGVDTGKILLAIGEISKVDGVAGTDLTFADDNVEVTFELEAITSEVNNNPATSSFLITGPAGYITQTVYNASTIVDGGGAYAGTPKFIIPPKTASGITARYTFAHSKFGHVVEGTPTGTEVSYVDGTTGVSATLSTTSITAVGSPSALTGVFNFDIVTATSGAIGGFSQLSLQIPVFAVTSTSGRPSGSPVLPIAWVLQGGTLNSVLDNSTNRRGGAILLEVEAPANPSITIEPESFALPWGAWNPTTNTFRYIASRNTGNAPIVLKATDDDFSGTVTYAWFEADDEDTYPASAPAFAINGVSSTNTDTLTIPSSSTAFSTDGKLYIYCNATSTASEDEDSNIITIEVYVTDPPDLPIQPGSEF